MGQKKDVLPFWPILNLYNGFIVDFSTSESQSESESSESLVKAGVSSISTSGTLSLDESLAGRGEK